jgi:hypothetical protein
VSVLSEALQRMIDQTTRSPIPAKRKLKSELHISIYADTVGYTVTISRDTVRPSTKEWETIFKHWPYYVPVPNADEIIDADNRPALRGRVNKRENVMRLFK